MYATEDIMYFSFPFPYFLLNIARNDEENLYSNEAEVDSVCCANSADLVCVHISRLVFRHTAVSIKCVS